MVKVMKDAGVLADHFTSSDVDVLFNKVCLLFLLLAQFILMRDHVTQQVKTVGARKLSFQQFNQLLASSGMIAS